MEDIHSWEQQRIKKASFDFHPDPTKEIDPVEKLLEKYGPDGAFEKIMEGLNSNPNDEELRRQANLLVNRLDDWSSQLRAIVQH